MNEKVPPEQDNYTNYRPLPHDVQAEQQVLSCCLLSLDAYYHVTERLTDGDFYKLSHQAVMRALNQVYNQQGTIELVMLKNALKENNQLEKVGGSAGLINIMETSAVSISAEYYTDKVKEAAVRRHGIQAMNQAQKLLHEDGNDPDEIIGRLQSNLNSSSLETDDLPDLVEQWGAFLKRLEKRSKGESVGYKTPWAAVNSYLKPLQRGDLWYLAARQKAGKTAMANRLMAHWAVENNIPTAFFSIEMGETDIMERMARILARVPPDQLAKGRLEKDVWDRLEAEQERLLDSPLIVDGKTHTMDTMVRRVRRYIREFDIEIVILDYVQLMARNAEGEGIWQKIFNISSRLKTEIAVGCDVGVVALSQVSQDGTKTQLRGARELEQDADAVLYLKRLSQYDKMDRETEEPVPAIRTLQIGWQRNAPTGQVPMMFDGRYFDFWPRSEFDGFDG